MIYIFVLVVYVLHRWMSNNLAKNADNKVQQSSKQLQPIQMIQHFNLPERFVFVLHLSQLSSFEICKI